MSDRKKSRLSGATRTETKLRVREELISGAKIMNMCHSNTLLIIERREMGEVEDEGDLDLGIGTI